MPPRLNDANGHFQLTNDPGTRTSRLVIARSWQRRTGFTLALGVTKWGIDAPTNCCACKKHPRGHDNGKSVFQGTLVSWKCPFASVNAVAMGWPTPGRHMRCR